MQLNDLVIVPIGTLFVGAALQAVCSRLLSAKAKGWLAFGTSLVALAAVLVMWPSVYHGHALDLTLPGWHGPLALTFHVDGLSQLFALMGAGIGGAILLYSIGYMAEDRAATRFYIFMQVFIAGLIALVYASNLLLMYGCWELIGLCSFMLVGFWYTQREAASGARKVLVMTHIAGYALLAAEISHRTVVRGMRRARPPSRSMSRVPVSCCTVPAPRNSPPLNRPWLRQ